MTPDDGAGVGRVEEMETMGRFNITNHVQGKDLGSFEAADAAGVLDAMVRARGCGESFAGFAAGLGMSVADASRELTIVPAAVRPMVIDHGTDRERIVLADAIYRYDSVCFGDSALAGWYRDDGGAEGPQPVTEEDVLAACRTDEERAYVRERSCPEEEQEPVGEATGTVPRADHDREVQRLTAERDEARAWVRRLTQTTRVLTCVDADDRGHHRRRGEMDMGQQVYEYERRGGGEWGSVRRTRRGFVIERHSRYSGTSTGERVSISGQAVPWASADLATIDNDGDCDGERLLRWLERHRQDAPGKLRVLKRGHVVQ